MTRSFLSKNELVYAILQVMINKIIWMLVHILLLKMMMIASWFFAFIICLQLEGFRKIGGQACIICRDLGTWFPGTFFPQALFSPKMQKSDWWTNYRKKGQLWARTVNVYFMETERYSITEANTILCPLLNFGEILLFTLFVTFDEMLWFAFVDKFCQIGHNLRIFVAFW